MYEALQFILFAVAAGALLLGVWGAAWRRRRGPQPRPPRPAGRPHLRLVPASPPPADRLAPDAAEQLRQVMAAPFRARPLLSRPDVRILQTAEAAIAEHGLPWRVMGRVRLGDVLASPNARAYGAIEAKRVDLLVVDAAGRPIAAIERRGAAAADDAVKKAALRRAGVCWIEVGSEHRPAELAGEFARLAAALGVERSRRAPEAPAAPRKD